MAFRFSKRSQAALASVSPRLAAVVREALTLSEVDFAVLEGRRSAQRQRQLVDAGASRTLNSKHLSGRAVDLAPVVGGVVRWDWPPFKKIAKAMKKAAKRQGVQIVWGGDWRTFKDGPHFELSNAAPDK